MGARSVTSSSQAPSASALGVTAALLVFGLLLAAPAKAERAVGLNARGVDPLVALHNDQGLDVRDALGRPVSAALVQKQLKAAALGRIAQAAALSNLPKAEKYLVYLEFALAFPAALHAVRRFVAAPDSWALPVKTRSPLWALAGAFVGLPACAAAALSVRDQGALRSRLSIPDTVVLRC